MTCQRRGSLAVETVDPATQYGRGWVRDAFVLLDRIASRAGLEEHERAEAVQEACLELLRRPPRAPRLEGLFHLVVVHAAMRLRKQDRSRRRREEETARGERTPSVLDQLVEAAVRREVRQGVARLDEPYRSVIALRYFEGLSSAAVAHRLGRTPGTVRSQVRRGLRLLRETMGR